MHSSFLAYPETRVEIYALASMRERRILIAMGFSLLLLFGISQALAAPPLNQKTTQEMAELLNRNASDKSMQAATTSAMKALMDLSASRVPSAVQNGYQAYGKFRNSETLDDLGYENAQNKAAMAAMGQSIQVPKFEPTSFRRLDPSFLREGEAGKVAAEFERQSGMKREKFLSILSSISEKKIDPKDPQMIDKVLSRFESFLSEIPNKAFREKLESAIKKVPDSARKGIIAKGVAKFAELAGTVSDAISDSASGSAPKTTPTKTAPEKKEKYQAVTGVETAAPSATTGELGAITGRPSGAINNVPVDGIVRAAIEARTEAEDSIFEQVRKRYRNLTPGLVSASEMAK
jgi:hypothetical protein